MTCDEGRPCQRCIKRDIGHLCHDEATPAKAHGDQDAGSSATPSKPKSQPAATSKATAAAATGSSATPPTTTTTSAISPTAPATATDTNANFFPTLGLGSVDAGAGGNNNGNGNSAAAFSGGSTGPYSSVSPMSSLNQNNADFNAANIFKPQAAGTGSAAGGVNMQPSTSNNGVTAAGMLSLASLFNMTNSANNSNNNNATGLNAANGSMAQPTQPSAASAGNNDISGLGGAGWLGLGGGPGGYEGGGSGFGGDSAGGNEFTLLSEFLESLDGPGFGAGATPGMSGTAAQTGSGTGSGFTPSQSRRNTVSGLTSSSGAMMEDLTALTPINNSNDRANSLSALTSSNTTNNASVYDAGYNGFNNPSTTTATTTAQSAGESSGKRSRRSSFSAAATNNNSTSNTQQTSGIASGSYLPSLQGGSSKTERFFLTAADQKDGTRDERLARVIQAKYEAGLLRPYNHVNGYARLNRWMERNVSAASKRRILKPLSVFRPAFRAVAQSLTNIDLVFIEEAFERLLLDYDRVFSTQGIPACLWRRTGEIYKGNKEFAELVGVPIESLREGRLCIYELMAEESAVNYWEKYGAVSFDPGQKAVLTSCVLRTKNKSIVAGGGNAISAKAVAAQLPHSATASGQITPIDGGGTGGAAVKEEERVAAGTGATSTSGVLKDPNNPKAAFIHCCFSFTIRRDQWNIPHMIVGNFLPTNPP